MLKLKKIFKKDTAAEEIVTKAYSLTPEQEVELLISLEESYDEDKIMSIEDSKKIHAKWLNRSHFFEKLKEKSEAKEIVLSSGATKEDIEKLELQLDLFKDKKELFDFNFQIMNCGTNTSGKVFKSLLMISVNMSH
jgi:hypothetical protein